MALSSSDGLLWGNGPMRVGGLGSTDCLSPGSMCVPNNLFFCEEQILKKKIISSKSPTNSYLHHRWDNYWRRNLGFGNWNLVLFSIHPSSAAATEISIPKLFRKPTLLFNKTVQSAINRSFNHRSVVSPTTRIPAISVINSDS